MRSPALCLAFSLAFIVFCACASAEDEGTRMLLEIWVNGYTHHVVAPVIDRNGVFWMSADDLATASIDVKPSEIGPDGMVDLSHLINTRAELVEADQKLLITTDTNHLTPQQFNLRPGAPSNVLESGFGFVGSYGLVGTVDDFDHTGQSTTGGATLGGTVFSSQGILSANGFEQAQANTSQFTRLDTTAEIDEPDKTRRWLFGDAITGSQNWSRSVRVAGAQLSTDFTLRPDLTTMPLPAFFGQTAVPATVDVFVNSARVFESNLEQGPFQINNLPVVTGSGEASIVTRDVLGQETTQVIPFFATNQLLKEDLESYALDVGALREAYGQKSFDYRQPVSTGTYSLGVRDWLTLQTHAEAAQKVQLAGGGVVFPLGPYGVMQATVAGSHSTDSGAPQNGGLGALSAQSQLGMFGLFGSVNKTFGGYTDIASIGGAPPPDLQLQLGGNINFGAGGAVALSWIKTDSSSGPARLVTASYTKSFANRWNIGTTGFYDYANHSAVGEIILTYSFGDGFLADATIRRADHANQEQGDIAKIVSPDGGFGYRLTGAAGDTRIQEGEATWIGQRGTLDGAFSSTNGVNAGRFTASGGIVAMDDAVYATRQPQGAVALVHTGQPDVRIYQENRQVAVSDDDGEALLTDFVPFAPNRISIDPRDYDLSTVVQTTEATIVPGRQSGVVVDLAPAQSFPLIVVLYREDGSYPPIGTRITFDNGQEPAVVGHHGEVFIGDLRKPVVGNADFGSGSCAFSIAPPQPQGGLDIPRLDPVVCAQRAAS